MTTELGATPYAGFDRRRHVAHRVAPLWILIAGLAGCLVAMLAGQIVTSSAAQHVERLGDAAGVVWLVACCEAALAMVLAWRISGRSREVWVAACLLLVGISGPVSYYVRTIEATSTAAWLIRPALVLLAAAYLVRASRDHDVVTGITRRAALRRVAVPVLAVLGLATAVAAVLPAPTAVTTTAAMSASSTLLCLAAVRADGLDRNVRIALSATFLLEASGRLLLLAPVDSQSAAAVLVTLALGLLGAGTGVVVVPGIDCFRSATAAARVRTDRLKAQAAAMEANRRDESKRRHDARGALAAVQLANEVLLQRADGLDAAMRAEMAAGVRDELRRVAALLQAGTAEPWRAADEIMDAVDDVRIRGGAVSAVIEDVAAVRKPMPLGAVVRLLLDIGSEMAPGRELRLRVSTDVADAVPQLQLQVSPARPVRSPVGDVDSWEAWSELLYLVDGLGGTVHSLRTVVSARLPLPSDSDSHAHTEVR